MCINIIVKRGIRGLQKQKNIRLKNRNGGITMRQRNEDGYLEVLSMEEYLTKRKKIREQEKRKGQERLKRDMKVLYLAGMYG